MIQNKQNSLSRISTLSIIDENNLEEAIEILFSHQKNCQKTGKYIEAEAIKKRLAKAKIELQKRKRKQLTTRFDEQRRQVQSAHLQEMTSFHSYWDNKFAEYKSQAQKLEQQTLQKHQVQQKEFLSVIQQSIPSTNRQTSEIIGLKKIQERLARKQQYVQAYKIQKQVIQLQKKENQKWSFMRNQKIKNLISQLKNKQAVQLSALRQKINQGLNQQNALRQIEQYKLIQKYSNFIKQLENKHNQQIIGFEKNSKAQSNINFSRSQMSSRVLKEKN